MKLFEQHNHKKTPTVLIVDDSALILMAESSLCRKAGLNVVTATCANDALKKINDNIDMILTDIEMPEMSGDELAKVIHTQHPKLPVIAITSSKAIPSIDQTHLFKVIEKPLSLENCQQIIEEGCFSNQKFELR